MEQQYRTTRTSKLTRVCRKVRWWPRLIKYATGPPPRIQAAASDPPLLPNESPHFGVATQVTDAMAEFYMNRPLTSTDLSRRLGACRYECRRDNGQFSPDFGHKIVGSAKGSALLYIFGGCVPDLYTFLTEERLPDGWEWHVRFHHDQVQTYRILH
ncbi:hypothetical protein BGW80DRAFT_898572 [Lactifluus volemus]|nr:hypothetical protein BGW80DRAFT_898572 [Lactifluus volemus]